MNKNFYRYESFNAQHATYALVDYFFKERLYLNTLNELNDPFEYMHSYKELNDQIQKRNKLISALEKNIKINEKKLIKNPNDEILKNHILDLNNELLDRKNKKNKIEFDINPHKRKIDYYFSRVKIKSFSANFDNIKMWSLYASGHTGYCVEFDFEKLKFINEFFYEVKYSQTRPSIIQIFKTGDFIKNMHVKSRDWSFEQEKRLFLPGYNNNYIQCPKALKTIYLGCQIKQRDKDLLLDYASNLDVKIYSMVQNETNFKLDCKQIK